MSQGTRLCLQCGREFRVPFICTFRLKQQFCSSTCRERWVKPLALQTQSR